MVVMARAREHVHDEWWLTLLISTASGYPVAVACNPFLLSMVAGVLGTGV